MKFAIFEKTDKDVSNVTSKLLDEISIYPNFTMDNENPEIVFVLGGDGSLLKAAHKYMNNIDRILFVGIRCGTLGFFYDFSESEIPYLVKLINDNQYHRESHNLLECHYDDKVLYAINEIRFESIEHVISIDVLLDDEYFETYHGNGMLVCSELGSTAYNKSLGGAVINQKISVLELTEIAPISNNMYRNLSSSYILDKNAVLKFKGNFKNAIIGYDHLTQGFSMNELIIKSSSKRINLIYDNNHTSLTGIKRSFIK